MTKLDVPGTSKEPVNVNPPDPDEQQVQMMHSVQGAAQLATLVAEANIPISAGELVIALLLYAGHLAGKMGASKGQFVKGAAAAFSDAKDLFQASGQAVDVARPKAPEAGVEEKPISTADVLRKARALVARGWVQGEQAMKWLAAKTEPEGKKLVNCNVKDPYAHRWSAIGAIDCAAPTELDRIAARDVFFQAVRKSGFKFVPGSLVPTILVDWNDYGWAPPVPPLVLPQKPDTEDSAALKEYERVVGILKTNYEKETLVQWPKPKPDARTKEEVLAMFDQAIALASEASADVR